MTVARTLARFKLDLVGAQELMWEKGGMMSRGLYFLLWKRNKNHQLETIYCTPENSISS